MTNEEKANEISEQYSTSRYFPNDEELAAYSAAMQMAEWKDKQHSVAYVVTSCEEHDDYVEEVFFDIEKAEQYCAKYNNNEDSYRRHITKVNVML